MSIEVNLNKIKEELPSNVKLVAVSKFHPTEAIMQAYQAGQRIFGESRPQEFSAKVASGLPEDICWHFIGHLQTNKLKLVLPNVSMVESIDSIHLLEAVDRWGRDNGKVTDILLEYHLGAEDTKGGLTEREILSVLRYCSVYANVNVCGLMGMATNTDDEDIIRSDFRRIADLKARLDKEFPALAANRFRELSIGMSGDWKIALEYGATIVRIGTSIFGEREY